MNTFFTADEHSDHRNVISLSYRPFVSLEEMVQAQVDRHNAKVTKKDLTIHLGDVALRDPVPYISRLNGRHWLLYGNHDRRNRISCYERVEDILLLKGMRLFLAHYAHLTWPQKHYGFMHLFGHSHGMLLDYKSNSMDVGQDVHDFTPLEYEEVLQWIRKMPITA